MGILWSLLAACGDADQEDADPALLTQGVNECHSWARSRARRNQRADRTVPVVMSICRLDQGERVSFPSGNDDRVSVYEGRHGSPDGPPTVELGTPYTVFDSSGAVVEESELHCVVAERGGGIERLALDFRD